MTDLSGVEQKEIEERLDIMQVAVLKAGEKLKELYTEQEGLQQGSWEMKKHGDDIATNADLASEKILLAAIPEGDIVFSEEKGQDYGDHEKRSLKYYWVLDPLDGTSNFKKGGNRPFTVNAALKIGGFEPAYDIVGGVVLDVLGGDLFRAQLGRGATKNNETISVSRTESLKDARIFIEEPELKYEDQQEFESFKATREKEIEALKKTGVKIESAHTGAWGVCKVAEGAFDAYIDFSGSTKFYDVDAATIIATEAGVDPYNLDSELKTYDRRLLIANSNIQKEILEVVQHA